MSLFVMIYGHYPFNNPDSRGEVMSQSLLQRIRRGTVDIPTHQNANDTPVQISEGCRHLLSNLLERDPEARFSMEVSSISLRHKFSWLDDVHRCIVEFN